MKKNYRIRNCRVAEKGRSYDNDIQSSDICDYLYIFINQVRMKIKKVISFVNIC